MVVRPKTLIFYRLSLLAEERTPCGGSGKVHYLVPEAEPLKVQKSGQFPDESVRIKSDKFTM